MAQQATIEQHQRNVALISRIAQLKREMGAAAEVGEAHVREWEEGAARARAELERRINASGNDA